MRFFKLNKNQKNSIFLLYIFTFALLPILVTSKIGIKSINSNISNSNAVIFENEKVLMNSQNTINKWDALIKKYDLNQNSLSDKFEVKLDSLKNEIKFGTNIKDSLKADENQENDEIDKNSVPIIIRFPEYKNYSSEISVFENLGGKIKHTYNDVINGFAGTINYYDFMNFYKILEKSKDSFLIEEDGIVKSSLYYASLNMNLRPYVWNTLGISGDNDSSIAILDTGIDYTHECFDNFSTGDFRNKIIAWNDYVTSGPSPVPFDDNGHGSHCAGIAAGVGTPIMDSSNRMVATESFKEDFWPYAYRDGFSGWLSLARFNVTVPGDIDIECNFTDFTLGSDRIYSEAALYYGDSQVDVIGDISENWFDNLSVTVPSNQLGAYELRLKVTFDDLDIDGDPWVYDPIIRFRAEIHWPFNAPTYGCGNLWKGVAPDTHLVGVKVLDEEGSGFDSDIIKGITWVRSVKEIYNITVISMSLGGTDNSALIDEVDAAVEDGIVVVVAAGNSGAGGNYVDCPGNADNAITVAAMNYQDQVTDYSSQGGISYSGNTNKPDILAPGGSVNDFNMFSAETNDDDAYGNFTTDFYTDDLMPAQGTSMATPAVAGAASLLIKAMGGGNSWDWGSGAKPKLVKSILLMTATETFPLQRETDTAYSPVLNRGGKDVHEGYGRINIDAAIRAWTNSLGRFKNISVWLNTSYDNSFGIHADAGFVDLLDGQDCMYNLTVPTGMDYDLYLYNSTPDQYGEPIIVSSSTSASLGGNEIIHYTATHDGRYFLVIKAIGKALPSIPEDDDNGASDTVLFDIIEFFLSPLGLILILSVVAVIFVIVIVIVKTRRK